jgi:hypothetical protein
MSCLTLCKSSFTPKIADSESLELFNAVVLNDVDNLGIVGNLVDSEGTELGIVVSNVVGNVADSVVVVNDSESLEVSIVVVVNVGNVGIVDNVEIVVDSGGAAWYLLLFC